LRPSACWLCGLPPTASITEKMSHRSSTESSPSHEPLAIGEGEEAFSSRDPNRMDGRMAKRVASPTPAAWLVQFTLSPFMTARKLVQDCSHRLRRRPAYALRTCSGLELEEKLRSKPAPPSRSPRYRHVFPTRECACRAIRTEQRNAHHFAGAILDRLSARISIEIRLSECRGD
jgi:hypothetical protein